MSLWQIHRDGERVGGPQGLGEGIGGHQKAWTDAKRVTTQHVPHTQGHGIVHFILVNHVTFT